MEQKKTNSSFFFEFFFRSFPLSSSPIGRLVCVTTPCRTISKYKKRIEIKYMKRADNRNNGSTPALAHAKRRIEKKRKQWNNPRSQPGRHRQMALKNSRNEIMILFCLLCFLVFLNNDLYSINCSQSFFCVFFCCCLFPLNASQRFVPWVSGWVGGG